ncbi:hypothetical protein CDL15_Pgr012111 [Punica granatum]|uniref:GrpE protein homolog n=1 Tax=Punica granatum TaxID=22663 RepID=A0A218XMZ4_PUNGR|nr:hypothetical protein CDL15_Pgr012111 [Punica granatum]
MLSSRVLYRASRGACRFTSLLSPTRNLGSPILSHQFYGVPCQSPYKSFMVIYAAFLFLFQYIPLLRHSNINSYAQQRFGISSTTSSRPSEKDQEDAIDNDTREDAEGLKADEAKISEHREDVIPEAKESNEAEKPVSDSDPQTVESQDSQQSTKRRRRGTKRIAFSDTDSDDEGELSMEKLAKLVADKEELLKLKHKEIEKMQDKVLQSYAEMENVMDRTRRKAENSKKYAIQPLLKTLLEGVEMTEKQLLEAFKKFGIEKYDPTNEPFDPNRHNAVFQMPDSSKPPGTVAAVLKAGYMLYDRVLRPAEVGVTQSAENDSLENINDAAEKDSEA